MDGANSIAGELFGDRGHLSLRSGNLVESARHGPKRHDRNRDEHKRHENPVGDTRSATFVGQQFSLETT